MNNPDWRLTLSGQHQMWATITGLSITGLAIVAAFGDPLSIVGKITITVAITLLVLQIILLLTVAEIERRTAFRPNEFLQNLENVLRLFLNIITTLSWIAISILILIVIWGIK